MRKINTESYFVVAQQPVNIDGRVEMKTVQVPYQVKESLINLLFNTDQKLGAVELLKRDGVGKRILDAGADLLLEEQDYQILRQAVEAFQGFGRNEVELVKRVLEAPVVQVAEKV